MAHSTYNQNAAAKVVIPNQDSTGTNAGSECCDFDDPSPTLSLT
jgi:hypothetical protein